MNNPMDSIAPNREKEKRQSAFCACLLLTVSLCGLRYQGRLALTKFFFQYDDTARLTTLPLPEEASIIMPLPM